MLECLNEKIMWGTLINMNKLNFFTGNSVYNPEIILPILLNIVKAGSDVMSFGDFLL